MIKKFRWPEILPNRGGKRVLRKGIVEVSTGTLGTQYTKPRSGRWYETNSAYEVWDLKDDKPVLVRRVSKLRVQSVLWRGGRTWG